MGTALVILIAFIVAFVGLYVRYRGKRIVTCPETNAPAGAEINAALAAGTWLVTQPRFVVTACSRWPERAGCDQACAPQVEASPDETLVRSIVAKWYRERTCVYCAQPIREEAAPDGVRRMLPQRCTRTLDHAIRKAPAEILGQLAARSAR